MDLTSPVEIKNLLSKYNAKPSKGLGQNFLIDRNILNKITEAADIKPGDTILEVGPGIGVLTAELAQKATRVIAVEKDGLMIEILKETLTGYKNVEIIQGDALTLDARTYKLDAKNYKVVANIPYYITSPLIRKFLEAENQPTEIILMVQKEVAQRICAKPPNMSLLAVSVQFYAEPKIISYVSKNCFYPAPKIDSAIIKIHPTGQFSEASPDLFFKVVKAGFSHPRKQLAGNLVSGLKIKKEEAEKLLLANKIDPKQRAETLSVENWVSLANSCG